MLRFPAGGSLDVAPLALKAELGDVVTHWLFSDPFVPGGPTNHRLAGCNCIGEKDLFGEQVRLLEDSRRLRDQALPICDRAGACELSDSRARSLATLVQVVSWGVGMRLVPESSLAFEAGRERRSILIPFGARGPSRTVGRAWCRSSLREQEFRLLGESIQKRLRATAKRGPARRGAR